MGRPSCGCTGFVATAPSPSLPSVSTTIIEGDEDITVEGDQLTQLADRFGISRDLLMGLLVGIVAFFFLRK